MSTLSQLASISVASSAAGVGLSAGRDIYRSFGRHAEALLIIALAVAGPGVAAFFLRRGTERGWLGAFFLLFLPCLAVLAASVLVGYLFVYIVEHGHPSSMTTLMAWIFGWQAFTFVVGFMVAGPVRRRRKAQREIEDHNTKFLQDIGFRDLGGRHGTWLDSSDRELVLDDARTDALVFRIKEKRGGRSMIFLDPVGRMVRYATD